MSLETDIKTHLVTGNSVTLTIRYNPGVDYAGVVGEIKEGTFQLLGNEILNPFEHFSNISADPVYRTTELEIVDITSIKKT